MITQRPPDGQRPARRNKSQQPDDGYLQRTDAQLRRERIAKLVDAIQRTRPPWSRMTPWDAEKILEAGAKSQGSLFSEGGDDE